MTYVLPFGWNNDTNLKCRNVWDLNTPYPPYNDNSLTNSATEPLHIWLCTKYLSLGNMGFINQSILPSLKQICSHYNLVNSNSLQCTTTFSTCFDCLISDYLQKCYIKLLQILNNMGVWTFPAIEGTGVQCWVQQRRHLALLTSWWCWGEGGLLNRHIALA